MTSDPGDNPDAYPNPFFIVNISTPRTNAMSQVLLEWKLNNQKGAIRYQIEKSVAGRPYSVVGSVSSDLNYQGMYSMPVVQPQSEVNYYRIATVSENGKKQYSKVYE